MKEKQLVEHARKQIQQLKAANVPQLMLQRNTKKLREILKNLDYSAYENCRKPKFEINDLVMDCEETILATIFYVFGNPYVKYGDGYFFRNSYHFRDVLQKISKPWANRLVYILYGEGDDLDYVRHLSMYNKEGITLPQLVGLEEPA